METQETNSMAQANANYDRWKDARDVYKALSDFVMDKERTLPMHDADWIEFARYYAQRCGVQLDGECEHPCNIHDVVCICYMCGKVIEKPE